MDRDPSQDPSDRASGDPGANGDPSVPDGAREARLAGVVCEVVAAALRDAGDVPLLLVDDGSPEARLCGRWLDEGLGSGRVVRFAADPAAAVESPLQPIAAVEAARAAARTRAATTGGLVAGPANRTTLLLAPASAPDPVLPLGDLWASRIRTLAGAWSGPPVVMELAARFGGVDALDAALAAWVGGRRLNAGHAAEGRLRDVLLASRGLRRWPRLVPKLENRTAGLDLGL